MLFKLAKDLALEASCLPLQTQTYYCQVSSKISFPGSDCALTPIPTPTLPPLPSPPHLTPPVLCSRERKNNKKFRE